MIPDDGRRHDDRREESERRGAETVRRARRGQREGDEDERTQTRDTAAVAMLDTQHALNMRTARPLLWVPIMAQKASLCKGSEDLRGTSPDPRVSKLVEPRRSEGVPENRFCLRGSLGRVYKRGLTPASPQTLPFPGGP
ncbi:unnamed protein product [Boreogadus saida]